MDLWLVAGGLTSLLGSSVYAYVGRRLAARPVPVEARFARTQFSVWWYGLAASGIVTGLAALVAAEGGLTLPLALTDYFVMLVVDVALLWGLVGYLTYVYTGRYHLLEISGFYALFYVGLLYFVFVQVPTSASIEAGAVIIHYQYGPPPLLAAFVVLALLLPEFIGTFLYLSLYRRTGDPTRRFRILLVGASLVLWFSTALFVPSTAPFWGVVKGGIETLAALLSLAAYWPPRSWQVRFGVQDLDGSAGGA